MAKAHALIIDDNAENIEVLARLLAANDVTHTAVLDTNQLENILQGAGRMDVIFLDIKMPKQNGYEILASLRTTFDRRLPIVAYTVHSNEIATAREMGFDGFLAKPLNPQLFSTQLSQILSGESVWDAS